VKLILLGLALCLATSPLAAAAPTAPVPVRDTYADLDALPPPPLMSGVGNSHLPITTTSELAQQYFDQGVSLLHDFWEFEAYRAFRHAATLDPASPMPYWGMYVAAGGLKRPGAGGPSFRENAALKQARALRANASEREQYYIRAIEHLAENEGEAAYRRELEALLNKYPDETEAALFLALSLLSGFDADGNPNDGQMYAEALLTRLLATHPDHQGLLHYWIHAQEPGERPGNALDAARRLADLAPDAGHIVHMPGHIYFIMGDYPNARAQFERAVEVGRRYMREQDITVLDTWNYIHNLNFLVASVAEEGRYDDGLRWATSLPAFSLDASDRDLFGLDNYYLQGLTMPARVEARFGNWSAAAERVAAMPADAEPWGASLLTIRTALLAYTRGRAAVAAGDLEAARSESERLDAALWRAAQSDISLSGFRQMPLQVAALDLAGVIAAAAGDVDAGIKMLEEAAEIEAGIRYHEPPIVFYPALQSLGDVNLAAGRGEAAREAYEALLKMRPNSAHVP
jgi:tetratricopeptide (TPR) repeat protein